MAAVDAEVEEIGNCSWHKPAAVLVVAAEHSHIPAAVSGHSYTPAVAAAAAAVRSDRIPGAGAANIHMHLAGRPGFGLLAVAAFEYIQVGSVCMAAAAVAHCRNPWLASQRPQAAAASPCHWHNDCCFYQQVGRDAPRRHCPLPE